MIAGKSIHAIDSSSHIKYVYYHCAFCWQSHRLLLTLLFSFIGISLGVRPATAAEYKRASQDERQDERARPGRAAGRASQARRSGRTSEPGQEERQDERQEER